MRPEIRGAARQSTLFRFAFSLFSIVLGGALTQVAGGPDGALKPEGEAATWPLRRLRRDAS